MPHLAIAPSHKRALALDAQMRRMLRDSLAVLADCFDPAELPDLAALRDYIARLDQGLIPGPADYGRHYQLAGATLAEDVDGVRAALAGFARAGSEAADHVTRWTEPAESDLQQIAMDRFGSVAGLFHPVDTRTFALFKLRLEEGLALLDRTWPEMAAEVRVLVRQVLVATGSPSAATHFDGGSHYQLWGLLILNPAFHLTPLAMAEVLVHEASHLLLFGFTTDEPLVTNPEGARYPSPLRRDLRPMDGIFHAAYVSARMALTMDRLAAAPGLAAADRAQARKLRDEDIANFRRGAAVVREHGILTATGAAVFAQAEEAMRALAAEQV